MSGRKQQGNARMLRYRVLENSYFVGAAGLPLSISFRLLDAISRTFRSGSLRFAVVKQATTPPLTF
jgi:hypothetical protein